MRCDLRSRLFGLVSVAVCVLHLGAQTSGRQAGHISLADTDFRAGYAAFERGDLMAARAAFLRAVRLAPRVAAGHSALGAVMLALGDPMSAIAELERARLLDPSDKLTLENLAGAYSSNNEFAKSVAAYHRLRLEAKVESDTGASSREEPLSGDTAVLVATALEVTGEIAEAHDLLRRAVEATPESAPLHDAFGAVSAHEKQNDEAEHEFRRAIQLDESLAAAHFHLGSLFLETNRVREAEPELSKAYALNPRSAATALQWEKALAESNQDERAIELLRALLADLPGPAPLDAVEAKYRLATELQATGKAEEAIPLFTEVISARPNNVDALINAGLAQVQTGKALPGIALYLRALALKPADVTLRENLGVAYLQQNDLTQALEQFRAGLVLDDTSPQLHYDLGLALKLKDDLAAAIPEFERSEALDPALPDPPYTLGVIFMQQGRFTEAAASLEKATELRPDNGDAWSTLGSVYREIQQPEKAEIALRKAINLSPTQPSPHILLAAILSAAGKRQEASAERKTGAELTRLAVNRQKADFALDSGLMLMKRGHTDQALVQFENASEADPEYAAAHTALAAALERSGRKAEAAEERRKAAELAAKNAGSKQ